MSEACKLCGGAIGPSIFEVTSLEGVKDICTDCQGEFVTWLSRKLKRHRWELMKAPQSCDICGKQFRPKTKQQVHCSFECRMIMKRKLRTNRLAWQPVNETFIECFECKTQFKARGSNSKYCSVDCRQAGNFRYRKEWRKQRKKEGFIVL